MHGRTHLKVRHERSVSSYIPNEKLLYRYKQQCENESNPVRGMQLFDLTADVCVFFCESKLGQMAIRWKTRACYDRFLWTIDQ